MSAWIMFAKGLFTGIPFGALFNIPKWGNRIVLGGACLAGLFVMLNPGIIVELSSTPWYITAANLLGIIIGQLIGRSVLVTLRDLMSWV